MATLAVLVHYDPRGEVAPHVRYQIEQIRPVADHLTFVTTSDCARPDGVDQFIARSNSGYDFYSWRTGLLASDYTSYDRVILSNDSYVGPLVPVAELLADAEQQQADAYGITISPQYHQHIQSYFTTFNARLIQDPHFQAFWQSMKPIDDREVVIDFYELGLGRLLTDLDARLAAYFTPTAWQQRIGFSRSLRSFARRKHLAGAYGFLLPGQATPDDPLRGSFSPIHMLWDQALTGALPAVKVAHFRERNPPIAKSRRDLARLERAYPEAFAGFREFLAATGGPVL